MDKFAKAFDTTHIFRLTDDTGMFQHARFSIPDPGEGYTTDDNARALIMAVMLYEKHHKPSFLALVYRYLGFVLYAQSESGHFRNFMTYSRQFTEKEGSEDCFGRCLWSLGYTLASPKMPKGIKEACLAAYRRSLPHIPALTWPHGQAYTMIGLGYIGSPEADCLLSGLADSLVSRFEDCAGNKDWHWFGDKLTYDNALFPWALFVAYHRLKHEKLLSVAQASLEFLDHITFRDGFFRAVGCKGWLVQGSEPAEYDEQPIEACTATLAHLAAYEAKGDRALLELAQRSFTWYLGQNSGRECLIDDETGGCCDGIIPDGLNRNQGAESIVSFCIASLALARYEAAKIQAPPGECRQATAGDHRGSER
jgi:hypothetical protein